MHSSVESVRSPLRITYLVNICKNVCREIPSEQILLIQRASHQMSPDIRSDFPEPGAPGRSVTVRV